MSSSEPEAYGLPRLRRGLLHLAIGRPAAALLRLLTLILLASRLPVADYGVYAALDAAAQLLIPFSLVGLDWIGLRYLPDYRLHSDRRGLLRLVLALLAGRVLVLAILCGGLALAGGLTADALGIAAWAPVVQLYLAVVALEALGEFLRLVVFQPLLLQGAAQANQVVRNGAFLLLLAAAGGGLSVAEVVRLELIACAVALALAVLQLALLTRGELAGLQRKPGWSPPPAPAMLGLGLENWLGHVVAVLSSSHMLMLLATRALGPEAAAPFGFARMLADQARRYLPAELLAGLIRPKLLATYSVDGDFAGLNERAELVRRLGLFVLAPGIALVLALNRPLLAALSGGQYGEAAPLLVLLLLALVPVTQRAVLTTVANAVQWPRPLLVAALASLAVPAAAWAALVNGLPVTALPLIWLAGNLLYNMVALDGLRRAGHAYRRDALRDGRILLAAALAAALVAPFVPADAGVLAVVAGAAAVLAIYLAAAALLRPFHPGERGSLNRFLGRRLFIW